MYRGVDTLSSTYTPVVGIFDEINELKAQRAIDAARLDALDARIAQLIQKAAKQGHGPTEIAREIGVTRARIHQILGKKRPQV